MKHLTRYFVSVIVLLISTKLLSNDVKSSTKGSHFMGSSLIHMPSTEEIGKGNLVFRFQHRFNNAKPGFENFYGLDGGANTQLVLDYGITDRWMVGIARTSEKKTWEARTKYSLLNQDRGHWFHVSFFGVAAQKTAEEAVRFNYFNLQPTGIPAIDGQINAELNEYELSAADKRAFLSSLLISRKFSEWLSIQASPMYVHQNFVKYNLSNDRTGLDVAARFKLSKRFDLVLEAIFTPKRDYVGDNYNVESQRTKISGINQYTSDEINTGLGNNSLSLSQILARNILLDRPVSYYYVPFSIGFDIETGGHVFQIFASNSRALAHTQLLRGAELNYSQREYLIGFNILRQFSLFEESWE